YDRETGKFTIGDVLTAEHGGKGVITSDSDGGSSGTLTLKRSYATIAALWRLDDSDVFNCVGDGIYVRGGDRNAGGGTRVSATTCRGWGIHDNSFLGNTWIACHTN